ncbi:MAG: hypothetical protein AAB734_00585 [Patescibacteria group bacterium]
MAFLWIVVTYFLLIWIALRLLVPNLGFRKEPLGAVVPESLMDTISKIDGESVDKHDFLRRCYEHVTKKYYGSRVKTVTHFWTAFKNPVNQSPGFMPCTNQNYLLRLMLVKSGRFQESDIKVKVIPLNLFVHQYLRVRVGGEWIDVDPWSSFIGVPLGKKSAFIG